MGEPSRDRIYGRNAVREAERGNRSVHRIWTSQSTSTEELTTLAGSPDHQGMVAEVDSFSYADPSRLLDAPDALVVALDQVQDPQNLGAVCRSAEAAGADGIVICERRAVGVTAAVCKASAGAVEHLPIARVRNLTDWIGTAKAASAWVYGAAKTASESYRNLDYSGRVVLVFGAEGSGIRHRVASSCDALVAIPTAGRVGSLNVSAAAAVLLFKAAEARSGARSDAI